jgi:2-iminobutanoate/2-iminopropanoate deaminase
MRKVLFRLISLVLLIGFPTGALAQTTSTETKTTETKKSDGKKMTVVKEVKKTVAAAPLKFVATDDAPKAIGAYSQGVVAGEFLFTAGQIPLDPKTGEMVAGGIEASTERVLDNLEAVLKAEGLSFSDVVKTTIYLTKAEDFAAMNGVYGRRLGDHKPARSTVIVAALPRNAPIEMDMIARTK